jgi:triacylglycerol lipase
MTPFTFLTRRALLRASTLANRQRINGGDPLLKGLNAPKGPGGDEVTPGLRWLTLRSDNDDKFAQPEGRWIGMAGQPTNVTFDSPALKGATTHVVLPGRDHREVSYHAEAFAQTWAFITGAPPRQTRIEPEAQVALDGSIGAAGMATSHVYRSPFPRSSFVVHFRPERLADADKAAKAVVSVVRPRGYFGVPRDRIELDGKPASGIPSGVAGVAASRLRLQDEPGRPVVGAYESGTIRERIAGRTWPAAENRLTVLELHD